MTEPLLTDNRRYYSLDALRGIMMMLGIVLHGSQWYITTPPAGIPMPADSSTSYLFDLVLHFIHSFRMPLFFVLAGFFASLLVGKRGFRGAYRNRVDRILIPLVLAALTILPLTMLVMLAFMTSARFDVHVLVPTMQQIETLGTEITEAGMPVDQPSLGHLWFLYYLLYFYLTIPLCFWLSRWSLKLRLQRFLTSPMLFPALALYTCATLWHFRGGVLFEGFIFIKPHLPSLIYYGSFFVLGYLMHHHRSMLPTFDRYLPWSFALSVLLFPLAVHATHVAFANNDAGMYHAYAVVTNAFLTWALIYLFLGIFLRYLDRDAPWILYISNSSYWVYLVHMPLVTFGAWLMLPFDIPALIKFSFAVGFTTVLCFVSYHFLIQRTWLGKLLNGKKFEQPWPITRHRHT